MKKRGFTLVEILSVLVVLSLILAIAVPSINKYLNQSEDKAYKVQINMLLDATESYANTNTVLLPEKENEIIKITLGQLKSEDFVKNNIKNPYDDKFFDDSVTFSIMKKGNSYIYEVDEETIKTRSTKNNSPTIKLTGDIVTYYKVDSVYVEEGAIAYDYNGGSLGDIVIDSSNIDMTTPGVYYVKYTVTDANKITSMAYRNIIVR